jgi:hypothetical protein
MLRVVGGKRTILSSEDWADFVDDMTDLVDLSLSLPVVRSAPPCTSRQDQCGAVQADDFAGAAQLAGGEGGGGGDG